MLLSPKFDSDKNIIEFNGSLVSLHCHHYNCGLLKTIEEIPGVEGHGIIVETAAEEFFANFKRLLSSNLKNASPEEALQAASELYQFMGFSGRYDYSTKWNRWNSILVFW